MTNFVAQIGVTQNIAAAGTSAPTTNAVNPSTSAFVRLVATTPCYVNFGTTPVATSADMIVYPGVAEYVKIPKGFKVAALKVGSGTDGLLSVTAVDA